MKSLSEVQPLSGGPLLYVEQSGLHQLIHLDSLVEVIEHLYTVYLFTYYIYLFIYLLPSSCLMWGFFLFDLVNL